MNLSFGIAMLIVLFLLTAVPFVAETFEAVTGYSVTGALLYEKIGVIEEGEVVVDTPDYIYTEPTGTIICWGSSGQPCLVECSIMDGGRQAADDFCKCQGYVGVAPEPACKWSGSSRAFLWDTSSCPVSLGERQQGNVIVNGIVCTNNVVEPECAIDEDCEGDYVCNAGSCVEPEPDCVITSDCPEGYQCSNYHCVSMLECLTDDDCQENEECIGIHCVIKPEPGCLDCEGSCINGVCVVDEETIPEETIPEETIPEETIPEETIPEETIPEEEEIEVEVEIEDIDEIEVEEDIDDQGFELEEDTLISYEQEETEILPGEKVSVIVELESDPLLKERNEIERELWYLPEFTKTFVNDINENNLEAEHNKVIGDLESKGIIELGDEIDELFEVSNSIVLEVDISEIQDLKEQDGVKEVHLDEEMHILLDESVPAINADSVWQLSDGRGDSLTGKGIKIAIIDTGIDYRHPDLGGCTKEQFLSGNCKVAKGYDFYNDDNDPIDDHGHGTHCAGIAAGDGTASSGKLKGVAPDATIFAYKIFNSQGSGSTSALLSAIDQAVKDGADIISLSLGGAGDPDDVASNAVDTAVESGVVVVVASGNSGPYAGTVASPGVARKALTIGASCKPSQVGKHSQCDTDVARFSSRGPVLYNYEISIKPEVVAPGVAVCAAQFEDAWSDNKCHSSEEYTAISGTSMATPHVAGVAALLIQQYPDKSAEEIREIIIQNAIAFEEPVTDQGMGEVDSLKNYYSDFSIDKTTLFAERYVGVVQKTFEKTYDFTVTNNGPPGTFLLTVDFPSSEGVSFSFEEQSFILNPGEIKQTSVTVTIDTTKFEDKNKWLSGLITIDKEDRRVSSNFIFNMIINDENCPSEYPVMIYRNTKLKPMNCFVPADTEIVYVIEGNNIDFDCSDSNFTSLDIIQGQYLFETEFIHINGFNYDTEEAYSDITIQNCNVYDFAEGIFVQGVKNYIVDGEVIAPNKIYIHDNTISPPTYGDGDVNCINVDGAYEMEIYNNMIYSGKYGIRGDGAYQPFPRTYGDKPSFLIHDNEFITQTFGSIYLDNMVNSEIYNNYFDCQLMQDKPWLGGLFRVCLVDISAGFSYNTTIYDNTVGLSASCTNSGDIYLSNKGKKNVIKDTTLVNCPYFNTRRSKIKTYSADQTLLENINSNATLSKIFNKYISSIVISGNKLSDPGVETTDVRNSEGVSFVIEQGDAISTDQLVYFEDSDDLIVVLLDSSEAVFTDSTDLNITLHDDSFVTLDNVDGATLYIFDSADYEETNSQNIVVIEDTPPTWIELSDQTIKFGEDLLYDITATDPDGIDSYWIDDEANFIIGSVNGILENKTILTIGEYPILVSVNDTIGNEISKEITITVTGINTAPEIIDYTPRNNPTIDEPNSQTFTITYSDVEGDASIKWYVKASGMDEIEVTDYRDKTTFLWPGSYNQEGVYDIRAEVSDLEYSDSQNWKLTINDVDNVPPVWIKEPTDQSINRGDDLQFVVEAEDDKSDVTYTLSDDDNFSIDSNGVVRNKKDLISDQYELTIIAKDESDNSISKTISITVRSTLSSLRWARELNSKTIEYGHPYNGMIEAEKGTEPYTYSINDDKNFEIVASPNNNLARVSNKTMLDVDIYRITVTAIDSVGNEIDQSVIITVEDTIKPFFTVLKNITILEGEDVEAQFAAYDISGIKKWEISDNTNFEINDTGYFKNKKDLDTGTYLVDVTIIDNNKNSITGTIWIWVKDTDGPGPITNLKLEDKGKYYLEWNWVDPTDADFAYTEAWVNGEYQDKINNELYIFVKLRPDTEYEIQLRTVDTSGNINPVWKKMKSRTLPIKDIEEWGAITGYFVARTIKTIEETNLTINYGTDEDNLENELFYDFSNYHKIYIDGLEPETIYYYSYTLCDIESCTDFGINSFTTKKENYKLPRFSKFKGTDFRLEKDLENVANATLEIENKGKIYFEDKTLDFNDLDLDNLIIIEDNKIEIKDLPGLNSSAVLTLYNLTFTEPIILIDGKECADCEIISYTGGTLIFSVEHFTEYSAEENTTEPYCGDGICTEDCITCPGDCGVCPTCGDGSCGGNENCSNCPGDCGSCGGGGGVSGGGTTAKKKSPVKEEEKYEPPVEPIEVQFDNFEVKVFKSVSANQLLKMVLENNLTISELLVESLQAEEVVELRIEEIDSVDIPLDVLIYKYLKVSSSEKVSKAVITFRVSNAWMADHGLTAEDIAGYHFKDNWDQIETDVIGRDAVYSYFEIEVESFSLFAVGQTSIIIAGPIVDTALYIRLIAVMAGLLSMFFILKGLRTDQDIPKQ